MFKVNPDGMRMEPTPERVLSVCRLIAHKSMSREEVRKVMTLGKNDEKELDQINKSINVALDELSLLQQKGEQYVLAVDPSVIETSTSFRRYVAAQVFSRKDTTFYLFTKWVLAQNERLFTLKSWEGMAKTCGAEVTELKTLGENSALGWRFWAAFLGIGYLSGTMIIPNMKLRIQDILATDFGKTFQYNDKVRATDFMDWLQLRMPEVDLMGKLPLGFSAGLRTLHELGLIQMETWRDSNRIMLYRIDGEPINEFSHITVKEEVSVL